MTTVDVLIVAKESILIEKFKKNVKSHFFSHTVLIADTDRYHNRHVTVI